MRHDDSHPENLDPLELLGLSAEVVISHKALLVFHPEP
jgi:hypothetical protein